MNLKELVEYCRIMYPDKNAELRTEDGGSDLGELILLVEIIGNLQPNP